MHLLNVLYYYYYLFYSKIIRDPEPKVATLLALSFSLSLLINSVIDIIALKLYCYEIKVWFQFTVLVVIVLVNYFVFLRTGKSREIIKAQPTVANKRLSILITLFFFLATTSWLFWGPIYGKHLLEICK